MNGNDGDSTARSHADVEQNPRHAALPADEVTAFTSQVRVTFYHTRKRLADIDGLSGKAVLDGIVALGILSDDSAKQVAEVRHCQIKGTPEETRIVIEEI
jgi:Holliday junction resolvase RusA-like endonuclease